MSNLAGAALEKAGGVAGTFSGAVVARVLTSMPNRNDKSPQGRLEFIVAQALPRVEERVMSKEQPPIEYFKAPVILGALRTELEAYRAGQLKKGEYTVLTQLIANEISAIDDCLSGSCIAKANGALEAYIANNSIAKPDVKIKVAQPNFEA